MNFNIWTICSDFEYGLVKSIKAIFLNTRHVGCLFHYVKQTRLQMSKLCLYSNEYKDLFDLLLKNHQCSIEYNNDSNIITKYTIEKMSDDKNIMHKGDIKKTQKISTRVNEYLINNKENNLNFFC